MNLRSSTTQIFNNHRLVSEWFPAPNLLVNHNLGMVGGFESVVGSRLTGMVHQWRFLKMGVPPGIIKFIHHL